jgi:transposase-like protein
MTKRIERDPIYRSRRFQTETIELCIRWYITYRLRTAICVRGKWA